MVGEFPELQGVMGRYYALHDGEDPLVADAIRDHYAPKGPADAVPTAAVSIAVALADKLDQLVGFFAIGERPTGAGDPYALRRAALGHHPHHPRERPVAGPAAADRPGQAGLASSWRASGSATGHTGFPRRAVCACSCVPKARGTTCWPRCSPPAPMTTSRVCWPARMRSTALLDTDDGANLLTAYRRAANILRIEERKDGPHDGPPVEERFSTNEERPFACASRDADEGIARICRMTIMRLRSASRRTCASRSTLSLIR